MNSLWDKAERRERFTHAEAFYFADVMLSVNEGSTQNSRSYAPFIKGGL